MRNLARIFTVLALATLATACSGGGSSSHSTPTPQAVANVQQNALTALSRLSSGVVHVTGKASQENQSVDFTVDYRSAGDRFAYHAQSTFAGQPADVQVVGVLPSAFSLENGAWQPLPSGISLDHFRARAIWAAVPFPSATVMGTEQVAGVSATHYRYDGPTQLPFGELAGSLIASGDVTFTGDLTHVTVDYWVAQDGGYPVKATYQASGDGTLNITAELSNANDAAL